jgi:nicotinamidase-related amidase
MPEKNDDLHGNVPDRSPVALLLVDVINDMEFEGGDALLRLALPAAERIAELKHAAKSAGIPVIYANDNFGRWRSDFRCLVERCLTSGVRGEPVAQLLVPEPDDYFILKPKHSAFHATALDTLLRYLHARRLILAGFATDACVTVTAAEAHMRDYRVFVPSDCVASRTAEHTRAALEHMARVLDVDTRPAGELDLRSLLAADGGHSES